MSDAARKIQKLKSQLDQINLSIEKLILPKTSFLHHIISLNQSIKGKEKIDLLSYYGLLKTFIPSEYSSLDSPRIFSLQEALLLKVNYYLSSLLNQAKLEIYSLCDASEKTNPIIRQLSANFIEMHVLIFNNLLDKKTFTDQQINYLSEKINSLETAAVEINRLNILEFIGHIKRQFQSAKFSLFWRKKTSKKLIQDISNLFEDINSKPLTKEALIGALNLVNEQLVPLLHKSLRNVLTHRINQSLIQIQKDSGVKKYNKTECINQFYYQANTLAIAWPVTSSLLKHSTEIHKLADKQVSSAMTIIG